MRPMLIGGAIGGVVACVIGLAIEPNTAHFAFILGGAFTVMGCLIGDLFAE